jgi:hypothetical protein
MKTRLAFSRLLVVFLAVGIMAGVAVSVPTVTLVSPPDGSIVNSTSVSFTCSAADLEGLTSAALYVGGSTTTVTFSGPTETDDAQISANSPNSNYGSLETINVDGYNPHAHAVIKFPNLFGVGQVPSGSSIVSATLEVNCFNYGNLMEVYRLTEDWVESEVTWNERAAGVAWTNAGADGPGSNAGVATTGDCSVTGWRTIDITQFVQEWSNGADNYGIVITDNGGTDGVDFYTSESVGNRGHSYVCAYYTLGPAGLRMELFSYKCVRAELGAG